MRKPTPESVRALFHSRMGELKPEEREAFRQTFIVHDYETYPNDTLLRTLDIRNGQTTELWGCAAIRDWLRRVFLRDESVVLVGYNNKGFDNRITDAILAGYDERQIKRLADSLVAQHDPGHWKSGDRGRPSWVGRTFDIGFDIGQKMIGEGDDTRKIPEVSLKRWERLNGIQVSRCSVPFDKPYLTAADKAEISAYCMDDCCATAEVVLSDEGWDACLNARRTLVDEYGHIGVDWAMTKPRITAVVLDAKPENYEVPADWDTRMFSVPDSVRIYKNRDVLDAFRKNSFGELRRMTQSCEDKVVTKLFCGIPHTYGIGGVHGCKAGIWKCYDGGIYSLDAASLYPNMMRHYNLLSRRIIGENRTKFGDMIDLRVKVYKPAKDKRAEGLKLMLNGAFGSQGFPKSDMYDPEMFTSITILGQLLITDLLEKLERHIELIQSNTDGIFFRLRNPRDANAIAECREIVRAFETRTKLEMEWTEFECMYQRDVSSYVARPVPKPGKPAGSAKPKTKGTWFGLKHCTVMPYLQSSRTYAALHDGAEMPVEGLDIGRFSLDLKRDKNSECFSVNGTEVQSEWLEVVPVLPTCAKRASVEVICKDDGAFDGGLFDGLGGDLSMRKRRKATGCPESCALASDITVNDIDLGYYRTVGEKEAARSTDEDADLIFYNNE